MQAMRDGVSYAEARAIANAEDAARRAAQDGNEMPQSVPAFREMMQRLDRVLPLLRLPSSSRMEGLMSISTGPVSMSIAVRACSVRAKVAAAEHQGHRAEKSWRRVDREVYHQTVAYLGHPGGVSPTALHCMCMAAAPFLDFPAGVM